jgi:hypothetical protein
MSSNTIVNGAPMVILRGTQDLSTRTLPVEAEVLPTHLPKVYIYAQKGPTAPQLVVGNSRNQMYGDDTFDLRKPFATHQTVLSNTVNAKGNSQMIERIVPDDVGPKSNFLLSLDVLASTTVQQYTRDANGAFILNPTTGLPVAVTGSGATLTGYKVKWVISNISTLVNESTFGAAANAVGDQTESAVQSQRYPILQFQASSYGSFFNNSGLRISAPTELSGIAVDALSLNAMKAYPFRLSAIRRSSATATPSIVNTEFDEPYFDFTLKAGQINPLTDANYSLDDIFLDKYRNVSDLRFPMKFGDFGAIKVYQANIDTLVAMFYAAESSHADANSDFTGAAGESYMFNFISGISSKGAPYYTFTVDNSGTGAIRLSENTNIYAVGGSDGTMNETAFAAIVADRVSQYSDPNNSLMDTATNVESIMYDSGFPLATKYAMCKFISERKDTAVVLSTYDVNGVAMTAATEHSMAVALRTRLQMYPESDYYGTSVMRGVIVGRYGDLRNSQYGKQLPLTIELASKAAEMMGAGDGRWKEVSLFDKAPNSEITMFNNINVTFTPSTVRNKDWDIGLNWVQKFSRNSCYFPALKTVYDNDTSVLNSFFTMMACVELQKVGDRVHKLYSGNVSLTKGQLIDKVNSAVEERTIGRFAGLYKIVPAAYYTDADIARGYSYQLPIKIYANGLSTVQVLSVQAYRMSDFVATT